MKFKVGDKVEVKRHSTFGGCLGTVCYIAHKADFPYVVRFGEKGIEIFQATELQKGKE